MNSFKNVCPHIYSWSVFSQEKQLNFNGTVVVNGRRSVLIDPVTMTQDMIQELKKTAHPEAILLTNRDHKRASLEIQKVFDGIPIWINQLEQSSVDFPVQHFFSSTSNLHGGLKPIPLDHLKTPGETAFFWTGGTGVMIVGDSVIGKPPGQLSLLPPEKVPRQRQARESISKLLELPFEILVCGDGDHILSGAHEALEHFLAQ